MSNRLQPALWGGLFIGVLSALPLVNAGNCCCCLWVLMGGALATYLRQQNNPYQIDAAEGAIVGLMAGVVGGIVYSILSIPLQMLAGPMQQEWMNEILSSNPNVTPEMREMVERLTTSSGLQLIGMIISIVVNSIFGMLGGLIGVAIFKRNLPPPPPPGTIDITPTSPRHRPRRLRRRSTRNGPYSFSRADPKFPSVKVCSRPPAVIPACGRLCGRACSERSRRPLIKAAMYESFYGFREKPFSLTPDPRYFYRSQCHANALELVQHAGRSAHGLTVVTGTSGTGKTTTCRTILESLDRKTFTSLVLNPYVSEEDLLRLILQDFGVISREEIRRGLLDGVRAGDLLRTLEEFLKSLSSLGARALLIVDEAQKLPVHVLEQVKRLTRLALDAPLQVVLVGQLGLTDSLRAPDLRPLNQQVTIRYRLRPLTAVETSAYIGHRLAIAGADSSVIFAPRAVQQVHRSTGGNPRLINLLCDRALLAAFSVHEARVEPAIVDRAASTLRLEPAGRMADSVLGWMRRRVAAL